MAEIIDQNNAPDPPEPEDPKYIINIGDFQVQETVYQNRCLSAGIGGIGVESETIPWADTTYQPWDYKYENEEFILDPIEIPEVTPEPSWNDVMESQLTYTAMQTNTLLPVAKLQKISNSAEWKEKIELWYKQGLWTKEMVRQAVDKGLITIEEYYEIVGEET